MNLSSYMPSTLPAAEPRTRHPQIMWALEWPALCGPVGRCAHRACDLKILQAAVPCHICGQQIKAGESFFPVREHNGVVAVQVHVACERGAR